MAALSALLGKLAWHLPGYRAFGIPAIRQSLQRRLSVDCTSRIGTIVCVVVSYEAGSGVGGHGVVYGSTC
jgi:hypothetical protein